VRLGGGIGHHAPLVAATSADQPADESWLTPGVRGIGGASLLADVGHEIPMSLLPSPLNRDARCGGRPRIIGDVADW
jgi:hypothetical protein